MHFDKRRVESSKSMIWLKRPNNGLVSHELVSVSEQMIEGNSSSKVSAILWLCIVFCEVNLECGSKEKRAGFQAERNSGVTAGV